MHTDVIVIGGGISGLTTALHCISHGYRCVLLERDPYCGGRVRTIFGDHWKYEAGAGRVHKNHHRTISLLKQFGMTLVELPAKKEYRDIHNNTTTTPQSHKRKNPSYELLQKVLRASSQSSKKEQQQMTFRTFCTQHLGEATTRLLVDSFGYNAEFEMMNAWDAIQVFKGDFATNSTYFGCKEGMGVWIERIRAHLESSGMASLLTGFTAYHWKRGPRGTMVVHAKSSKGVDYEMSCKVLVCAIPKGDLLKSFSWSTEQKSLLDSVHEVPLHRIYGQFPVENNTSWFQSLPPTTTNSTIRQFIPISRENGLAMISYSDQQYADYWKDQVTDHGDRALRSSLLQQLHVVFPEIPKIPKPLWVRSHYWNPGVHVWKPGYDSKSISTQLLQPFGKHVPMFLVGESYSMHQSWIEGALETVEEAVPRIHSYLQKKWYKSAF